MEHKKRIITALVLLFSSIFFYYFLRHLGVILFTAGISLIAYFEFLRLLLDRRSSKTILHLKFWSSLVLAALIMGLYSWRKEWDLLPLYFCFLVFLLMALGLSHFGKGNTIEEALEVHLKDAVMQSFGLFYITGFLSFVPAIHALPKGPALFLLLLLIIWGGDVGAYYGGRAFGHTPLSPNLSPKKTWEGAISGIILCLLTCIPIKYFLLSNFSYGWLFTTAVITSIVAQAGDLLESLMKRVAHVKDSGQLLPGHGGALDRFDSLILAAPIYYFFVSVFYH